MDIIEDVSIVIGDDEQTPTVFKLKNDYVFIADLCNHTFKPNGDSVKVYVRLRNGTSGEYMVKFECGNKKIKLIDRDSVVFSGFREAGGEVKAFKLNDSSNMASLDEGTLNRLNNSFNENNVITVTVNLANRKFPRIVNDYFRVSGGGRRGGDVVDGGGAGESDVVDGGATRLLVAYDTKEKSDISYTTTNDYYEGRLLLRFYIVLYKRYNGSGGRDIRVF